LASDRFILKGDAVFTDEFPECGCWDGGSDEGELARHLRELTMIIAAFRIPRSLQAANRIKPLRWLNVRPPVYAPGPWADMSENSYSSEAAAEDRRMDLLEKMLGD
jgi:hypothetical protein